MGVVGGGDRRVDSRAAAEQQKRRTMNHRRMRADESAKDTVRKTPNTARSSHHRCLERSACIGFCGREPVPETIRDHAAMPIELPLFITVSETKVNVFCLLGVPISCPNRVGRKRVHTVDNFITLRASSCALPASFPDHPDR